MTIKKIMVRHKKPKRFLRDLDRIMEQVRMPPISYSDFGRHQRIQNFYDNLREKLGFKRKYK